MYVLNEFLFGDFGELQKGLLCANRQRLLTLQNSLSGE